MELKEDAPKQQKKLCDYILENYRDVGLLTISQLADKAEVGTATVFRVAKKLGYRSYNEMKEDLYKLTIDIARNTWWHMENSFKSDVVITHEQSLIKSWQEILRLLDESMSDSLLSEFHKCINLILEANTVHILGLRSSLAPAIYFENLLESFYPKTNQLSYNSDLIFDRILQFEEGDILFVITNSPYTDRCLEAAEFCNRLGHSIILLTDHLSCPISSYADVILQTVPSDKQYSIVPAIAIIETIVIEIGKRTAITSIKKLKKLADILKEYNITRS